MECGHLEIPLASLLLICYNADNLMKGFLLTLKLIKRLTITCWKKGVEEGGYGDALGSKKLQNFASTSAWPISKVQKTISYIFVN